MIKVEKIKGYKSIDELRDDYGNWENAIIVFSNKSFSKEYDKEERSYLVNSDCKFFKPFMIGRSLPGTTLTESEDGVRLDYYIYNGWIIEEIYTCNVLKQ